MKLIKQVSNLVSSLLSQKNLTPAAILSAFGIEKIPNAPKNAVQSFDVARRSGFRVMLNISPVADEKRGFSATSFCACIGLIFQIKNEQEQVAMFLALLMSGFSGEMTRQTPNTMLYNLNKWSRDSVQSGAKNYASDFKQLAFYQSDDFKRQRAYLSKLFDIALEHVEQYQADIAAVAAERAS